MNKLTIVLFLPILFGCSCKCENKNSNLKQIINNWNENTFNFMTNRCSIYFDSLKLNDIVVPAKIENKIFFTVKQYLIDCLKKRKLVTNFINNKVELKKGIKIKIFESYETFSTRYSIQIDNKTKYILKVNNNSNSIKSISKIDSETEDDLFGPLNNNESDCFYNFNYLPNHVFIFSEYRANNGFITYKVSMFD